MLSGEIIVDGMAFGVEERELPSATDPAQLVKVKEVVLVPAVVTPAGPVPGPLSIRVRFTPDQYDDFIKRLQSARITIASSLNGNGGPMFPSL